MDPYGFIWAYTGSISEWGIALTGYVVPGCVEDGTWMLWENSSVVAVAVARSFLDKFSKQNDMFSHFSWKIDFLDILYLEGRFLKMFSICFPPLQGEVE